MASDPVPLAPLHACIRDLVAWSHSEAVPLVLIGGVAVSLLGRPRVTKAVAHRPRDLADIEGLLDAQTKLDRWRP